MKPLEAQKDGNTDRIEMAWGITPPVPIVFRAKASPYPL